MDSKIAKELQKFIEFAAKELGLEEIPIIYFSGHKEDKFNAFGHTKDENITVRVSERHPGDVMRTIAHELVHYLRNGQQNENTEKEDDANALAGRIMRKYNIKNPKLFKMKPIENLKETESLVSTTSLGGSGPQNPASSIAMPETMLMAGKMIKRKKLTDIIGSKAIRKETNSRDK